MQLSRLSIFLLFSVLLLAVAPLTMAQDPEHFDFQVTDNNMSVLILSAELDGESLVHLDEIGAFTTEGVCAGAAVVEEDFPDSPVGMAAWGAEQGEDNGFSPDEDLGFRFWQRDTDREFEAEIVDANGEPVYTINGFLVLSLAAQAGPEVPEIQVDAEGNEFGPVRVGQSEDWMFTVTNAGRGELIIDQMDITGDDADYFMVNFDQDVTLQANEEAEFRVTYAPEAEGEHSATLTIHSNDEQNENVELALTGSAQPALPPTIRVEPENIAFGDVIIGENRNRIITIYNDGDEALNVDEVTVDNEVFTTDFENAIEISAQGSAELVVTFEPEAEDVYQADVSINSNDPENEVVQVHVSGRGTEELPPPVISIAEVYEREDDGQTFYFAPFFGYVPIDGSNTVRLTILNEGESDLIVSDVVSDNEAFNVEFNEDIRVRPQDQNWFVEVDFMPGQIDLYEGVITFMSNDPDNEEFHIQVRGVGGEDQGTHFQWYVTPDNHNILVQSATLDGEALVEGDEIGIFTPAGVLAGGGSVADDGRIGLAAFGDDPESLVIDGFVAGGEDPGEEFRFKVWDADADIEAWAAISENINDGPEGFVVNGFTVVRFEAQSGDPEPQIYLPRIRHYFGQVRYEGQNTAEWTFEIRNRGVGDLEVESIESDFDEFTTDFPQDGATIQQGQILEALVTFDPTVERRYEGRLTINSNDPDHPESYVDVIGDGVVNPQNPAMTIPDNYFYGVVHLNDEMEYVLQIMSTGQADLEIQDIVYEGDEAFVNNWPDQIQLIEPDDSFDLTITFTPEEEREYNGAFTIFSNVDEEGTVFPVRGYGLDSPDHFLHLNTGAGHTIIVDEATITTLQDNTLPLYPGDEIAAFTEDGLCAGHIVIADQEEIAFVAYANQQDNDFMDGFTVGETFMFKFWDSSTDDELDCEITFVEGPEEFAMNGETHVELMAEAQHEEPMVFAEPFNEEYGVTVIDFGAVKIDEAAEGMLTIVNIGGDNLIVEEVTSDRNSFVVEFEQQVELEPGAEIEVPVTFTPVARNSYQAEITIHSNDPHEDGYVVYGVGIGSTSQGHFVGPITGENHSVLITEIDVSGAPPSVGSEVGIFTPAGICAGVGVVEEPDEALGLAVWGDDANTEYLVEGFVRDERMTLIYWDHGSDEEYEPYVEQINQNGDVIAEIPPDWEANGFSTLRMSVEGVMSIVVEPAPPIEVDEGDEVQFTLTLHNAEGDFDYEWLNSDEYDNVPENAFSHENNVGTFEWETGEGDNGEYRFMFRAFNEDDDEVRTIVTVTVGDRNWPPGIIDQDLVDELFPNGVFSVDEDQDPDHRNEILIVDLTDIIGDPDGDDLGFWIDEDVELDENLTLNIVNQVLYVEVTENWHGLQEDIVIIADDGQRDNEFNQQGRNVRSAASIEDSPLASRTVRRAGRVIDAGMERIPQRDAQYAFEFDLRVASINDAPLADYESDPEAQNDVIVVPEFTDLTINFTADNVPFEADEFEWQMDRDDLPDEAEFQDNGDGTATLTWSPGAQDGRDEPYTPEFTVDDGQDENNTTTIALEIRVTDQNRAPVITSPEEGQEEEVNEGVELTIDLEANDPDGDDIVWLISDLGGLPRGDYIQNNQFVWTPAFDDAREEPYTPTIVADDQHDENNTDQVTISITVNNINREPELRVEPEDRGYDEDEGRLFLADMFAVYMDADWNDENYPQDPEFVITQDVDDLHLLFENDTLWAEPTPNYNTAQEEGGRVEVGVAVVDQEEPALAQMFFVTINPVNDPPGPQGGGEDFMLETPEDGHQITYADSASAINFTWTEATQNQWEVDELTYVFVAYQEGNDQDSIMVDGLAETAYEIEEALQVAEELGILLDQPQWVNWRVWATDGEYFLLASNASFRFQLPALGVEDYWNASIPDVYYMKPNFPNPFNAETTIRFGLPKPGEVSVTVWDMHGRKVAGLVEGRHEAGRFATVWNANGLTSGIYLIRMESGEFKAMKKAVLVR